jgi:hypothetical protein
MLLHNIGVLHRNQQTRLAELFFRKIRPASQAARRAQSILKQESLSDLRTQAWTERLLQLNDRAASPQTNNPP